MKEHPEEGVLQAYLDGEVPQGSNAVITRHLEGCAMCRRRLEELERFAGEARAAFGKLETDQPDLTAARLKVHKTAADRRRGQGREPTGTGFLRRTAVAASFVLLFGAGVAAAMPGSPLRSWWEARETAGAPIALSESIPEGVAEPSGVGAEVGVGLALQDGALSVAFTDVVPGTQLEVTLVDGERASVFASEDAHFETGSGRVHVAMAGVGAGSAPIRIEVPRASLRGEVRVNGVLLVEVIEGEFAIPGPPPMSSTADALRFEAPPTGTSGAPNG